MNISKIIEEKNNLRKIFKEKRLALSQDEVEKKSEIICDNFIKNLLPNLLKQKKDGVFAVYINSYNEVSTKKIIDYFIKNEIKFCYPKIVERNSDLEFILHNKNQEFEKNIFFEKIIEPKNGEKILPDFLLVPLVAFDKNCNRLGMGGGFFDRTLYRFKTQNHKNITIGLAYDFELFNDNIPTENSDESLDFIVSQSNIFS